MSPFFFYIFFFFLLKRPTNIVGISHITTPTVNITAGQRAADPRAAGGATVRPAGQL